MEVTSYLTDKRTLAVSGWIASLFYVNLRQAPEGGLGPVFARGHGPAQRRISGGNRKQRYCFKLTDWK
jgi:hypothetical protein